jgi:hypothetical protein
MRIAFWNGIVLLSAGLVGALACAGTRLEDVGDIGGEGGEAHAGGPDGSSGDYSVSGGGTTQGGEGGAAGTSTTDPDPIVGGFGGEGGGEPQGFVCEACELVAETPAIRDVWVRGEQVYWIEYGGFDGLENYLENGRLMSMPVAGGEATVVAEGLQGPIQLAVSAGHAYVLVDRSSTTGGANKLLRVPLQTGAQQELQAFPDGFETYYDYQMDWTRRYLAFGGGYAFWRNGDSVYRLAEDAEAAAAPLFERASLVRLMADESTLYVEDEQALTTVSFSGVTGETLWEGDPLAFNPLALAPGHFYAVQGGATSYLARLPLAGGAFKRVGTLPAGWATRLQTDGTRFTADLGVRFDQQGDASSALWDGKVAEPESARMLASAPLWDDGHHSQGAQQIQWRVWDASPTSVFIGYGDQLYAVAREP